jgi:signal transduction histidine kinase
MGAVPERLRSLITKLRPPWTDVMMAAVLVVAGVIWVQRARHGDITRGPIPALAPAPPAPDFGVTPRIDIADSSSSGGTGTALLINIIAAVPVAVRRRLPYAAFVVGLGGVFALGDGLAWPGFVAILILTYSIVAYGRYLVGSLAVLLAAAAIAAREFSNSIPPMAGWFSPFAILVPVGLAAATIRSTRARADAAARRAQALEREKDASTRAAIAEERARLARELHDVVSHHVSVMVIQAGAAGKVIDTRPDLAGEALRAIESSGREAMGELRHLLGLVVPLDDRLHPQPGLDHLDALIGTVRAAGQPVTLRHESGAVPQGVDLTAYRVVQEGLTNAMRYAPGTRTSVNLIRDGDALVIEVRNEQPASSLEPACVEGAGTGLLGLAERLRLYDGTLDAGRSVSGGFHLTARIPLDGVATA